MGGKVYSDDELEAGADLEVPYDFAKEEPSEPVDYPVKRLAPADGPTPNSTFVADRGIAPVITRAVSARPKSDDTPSVPDGTSAFARAMQRVVTGVRQGAKAALKA